MERGGSDESPAGSVIFVRPASCPRKLPPLTFHFIIPLDSVPVEITEHALTKLPFPEQVSS